MDAAPVLQYCNHYLEVEVELPIGAEYQQLQTSKPASEYDIVIGLTDSVQVAIVP